MSANSAIEWTEATWNPVTGCDRVSPGCDHCYAMTLAKRLKAMGSAKYQNDGDPRTSGPGFGVTAHEGSLDVPLRWREPKRIFVNSMSDLFHDQVPDEFIARVFAVMALTGRHTFQVLTKRHARMRSLLSRESFPELVTTWAWRIQSGPAHRLPKGGSAYSPTAVAWPLPNVWLGVSVENQQWADTRIPALIQTPAAVRFLSCEPLLGPVDLLGPLGPRECDEMGPAWTHRAVEMRTDYGTGTEWDCEHDIGIDWVIAGGESGPEHRPLDLDWIRTLRDQCQVVGVPFLFKQVGGRTPKAGGRELDGRTWDEYPERAA